MDAQEEVVPALGGLGGKTVIIVTHDAQLAKTFASRTIEMQDGKVVADERR